MQFLPRSRRGTGLLAGAVWLAVCAGLWSVYRSNAHRTLPAGPVVDDVLPLRLELTAEPLQSRFELQARLRVKNVGSRALAWDEYWAVFLNWNVLNEAHERLRREDVTDKQIEKNADAERFVKIEPGASLAHDFRLTEPIREFRYEPRAMNSPDMESVEVPDANEVLSRFRLDPSIKAIAVQVNYYSGFKIDEAFQRYFSFPRRSVSLWGGKTASNELVITLKEP
jgi:hypothetical protein